MIVCSWAPCREPLQAFACSRVYTNTKVLMYHYLVIMSNISMSRSLRTAQPTSCLSRQDSRTLVTPR